MTGFRAQTLSENNRKVVDMCSMVSMFHWPDKSSYCLFVAYYWLPMGNIETVGPNEALVVSGGWCGSTDKKFVIGSWAWTWWLVSDVQRLSLQIMTLKPHCISVETSEGVPVNVTAIAQCKFMTAKEFLPIAAEQFLGMSVQQIHRVLNETLEGHLRSILGQKFAFILHLINYLNRRYFNRWSHL